MHYFIQAAEVWHLDHSGQFLQLDSAWSTETGDFQKVSVGLRFALGEGLPGNTWAKRRPLIWTDLSVDAFKRSAEAESAGYACAISMPIFIGEFLSGVVLLFCGGHDVGGAAEVWQTLEGNDNELQLADGYYGSLEQFEWISRRLTIMRGRGLPGSALANDFPVIMNDLPNSSTFLRARNAGECGITSGFAIPFGSASSSQSGAGQVVTFLSAKDSPIARGFELWALDNDRLTLQFQDGIYLQEVDTSNTAQRPVRGEGDLGEAWLTGRPKIVELDKTDGGHALIIPFIRQGYLRSIVRLYL